MPFLVQVIAAIGTALTAVSTAVTTFITTAAISAGITGAAAADIYFGATALVGLVGAFAVVSAVSAVASLFTPSPRFNTSPITFKADTSAGLPYVIGRSGSGGNIVFVDTSNDGNNTWLHYLTVHSIGPVTGFDKFTANNVPVTFDAATGQANHLGYNWRGLYTEGVTYYVGDGVSYSGSIYICEQTALNYDPTNTDYWQPAGSYAGPAWLSNMWQLQSLGPQPASYLAEPPGTGYVPEWTSSHTLSGLCESRWVLKGNTQSYPNGTPTPLWTIRGPAVYDPRLDSTYPGGSGPQRYFDWTTWSFSENPFLHALTWCLGQTSNGKRIMGLGAPIARIDVAAFVHGANVCDANGWKVGGTAFSTDSKWDVLTAMLQAGCGAPMRNGALISCIVNAPRVSIATLSGADFTGPVSVAGCVPRKDRINRVIYQYRSESHAWQMVPATPIVVDAYVAADGQQRTKGVTMNYVQDVNQGAQLARYAIEDARELGPITGQLRPCWMGLQPGDCVTIDEEEYGLNGQDVLILDRKIDASTACPNLTMRSETAAKHAFALGQTGVPPPAPSLTGVDLVSAAPGSPPWTAIGATIAGGGVSIPAIVLTGVVENPHATNLVVQIRTSAAGGSPAGAWTHFDSPPASAAARVQISPLASGVAYDLQLSYLVRGVPGDPLVISGITAGAFVGSGGSSSNVPAAVTWPTMTASGTGAQTATSAAQTITGITVPITLTLTYTGAGAFSYTHNGGTLTPFSSGATLTVNNGDTLGFSVSAGASTSGTLTVTNTTGGGTVGAPTYSLTVSGSVTTPSPTIAWSNISGTGRSHAAGSAGTQTFLAINVPITVTVTLTTDPVVTVSYSQNSGANVTLTSGQTIAVNPGDTLAIVAALSTIGAETGTIGVYNTTAGASLGTISVTLTVTGGGGYGGGGGGPIP